MRPRKHAIQPSYWVFVRFTNGEEYVMKSETVKDFSPSHPADFKKQKFYWIQWQKPSKDFDGRFKAKILFMAASLQKLKQKSLDCGLVKKMPKNFAALFLKGKDTGKSKPQSVCQKGKSFKRCETSKASHQDDTGLVKKTSPLDDSDDKSSSYVSDKEKHNSKCHVQDPDLKDENAKSAHDVPTKENNGHSLLEEKPIHTEKVTASVSMMKASCPDMTDEKKNTSSPPSSSDGKQKADKKYEVKAELGEGFEERGIISQRLLEDFKGTIPLPILENDKVNIGNDVLIKKTSWDIMKAQSKSSFFLRKLCQEHYGQTGLAARTTMRKPRLENSSKKIATPHKMETFIGAHRAYTAHVEKFNLDEEASSRLKKVDKEAIALITQKMQDEARGRGKKK